MKYDSNTVVDPVDLTAVKSYLSLNLAESSEDSLLSALVTQCSGILEKWLPFWMSMATIDCITDAKPIITLKGPVSQILGVYHFDNGFWEDITEGCTLYLDGVGLPEDIRGSIKVTYSTEGSCPAPVQTAILMMVRTLYLDREANPMTDAVMRIITPYLEVNL